MTPKRISTVGQGPYQVTRWAEVIPDPNGGGEIYKDEYFVVDLKGFGSISSQLSEGAAEVEAENRNKEFLLGVNGDGATPLVDEFRKKLDPERLQVFDQALHEASVHCTHAEDDMPQPPLGDLAGEETPPADPKPRRRSPWGSR